ncbi:ABC-three component system middle component 8 [Bradyrhizobium sp. DN5]|uniref:ABC-three component system middle component 8 n=1 Tax=Bradyrhizobium sp. DN5 TaxID=3056950 RepID=UPI0035247B41
MLIPSKHLDLDRAVVRVASELLVELRRRRIMEYDSAMRLIKRRIGDDGEAVIAPAISFLFLIGRLEYHSKNDTFEYRA